MPMNGAGVASPPSGTTAAPNTTVESAPYNAMVTDIYDVVTDHLATDGRKALTGNLPAGGFKLTGLGSGSAATDSLTLGQAQSDVIGLATTVGGTVDAITLLFTPQLTAYTSGMRFRWTSGGENTSTTPTVNASSLGVKTIVRNGGAALVAGDTGASGYICEAYYNGTNVVLMNPATVAGAASATVSGIVELATVIETATGTDTSRAITPNALSGLWGKIADIASAGTVTIGAGGYAHITGTTTITDIDFSTATNGRWAYIVFDAALTLTHNATTLILPGAADITTAAGDTALFIQDSADNIKCVFYQRASGRALIADSYTDAIRVTDSSITTNTVLASDSTLKFAMLANTAYDFEAWLLLDVDADSGWKLGTTGPAAPTEVFIVACYEDDNGTNRNSSQVAYAQLDTNTPASDRNAFIRIKGLIRNGANAGDFALQFAQGTSHATAFVIKRGSRLSYRVNA